MTIIDADKLLAYLIFSKHIDGLTCGEVKEAIEMCKVDVLDKIRAEIEEYKSRQLTLAIGVDDLEKGKQIALEYILAIIDKYKTEINPQESEDDIEDEEQSEDGELIIKLYRGTKEQIIALTNASFPPEDALYTARD